MQELRKVCAWCQRLIREASSALAPTSHGICPTCLHAHFPEVQDS